MKDSKLPEKKKIELFDLIYNMVVEKPNNYDLGEAIRKIFDKKANK